MTPTETATFLRRYNAWRRTDDRYGLPYPDPREISEAIDAAIEMIERLEAAESDAAHQKALADSALRVAEGWEGKCNSLRAKIETVERQEPIAWMHETRRDSDVVTSAVKHVWGKVAVGSLAAYSIPLYLAPGAQPAPSFADAYQGAMEDVAIWKKRALEAEDLNRKFVAAINGPAYMGEPAQPTPSIPEGWKLVPIEPTEEMTTAFARVFNVRDQSGTFTPAFRAALAAAPEAKP